MDTPPSRHVRAARRCGTPWRSAEEAGTRREKRGRRRPTEDSARFLRRRAPRRSRRNGMKMLLRRRAGHNGNEENREAKILQALRYKTGLKKEKKKHSLTQFVGGVGAVFDNVFGRFSTPAKTDEWPSRRRGATGRHWVILPLREKYLQQGSLFWCVCVRPSLSLRAPSFPIHWPSFVQIEPQFLPPFCLRAFVFQVPARACVRLLVGGSEGGVSGFRANSAPRVLPFPVGRGNGLYRAISESSRVRHRSKMRGDSCESAAGVDTFLFSNLPIQCSEWSMALRSPLKRKGRGVIHKTNKKQTKRKYPCSLNHERFSIGDSAITFSWGGKRDPHFNSSKCVYGKYTPSIVSPQTY
ncbi:hypothetical protein TcCL_NonESM01665 [Trypanosoma cruzi]|nr:hypothetical protein TcCL_NonESM01665 [Trypanosoma cruzi]